MDKFPNGDAGAIRQYSFAKLFQYIGIDPIIICMGTSTNFTEKIFDSIGYTSFRSRKSGAFFKILDMLQYKKRLKILLYKLEKKISYIFVSDIPFPIMIFIKNYAVRKNICLLHDSIEWYSPEQFFWGVLAHEYICKNILNRLIIKKPYHVITISQYLYDYFFGKGLHVIRIPAILDVKNMQVTEKIRCKKLILVYAGSPGKKDHFTEIFDSLYSMDDELRRKIEFRIVGSDTDRLLTITRYDHRKWESIKHSIKCYARMSRENAVQHIKEADFTVLMRSPNHRYAKAGFPTKIAESMAYSTPVICNLTSDLNQYLIDNLNCLIVHDHTSGGFSEALKRAWHLSNAEKANMRIEARKCAEIYFDFRTYTNAVHDFLNTVP